MYKDRNLIFQSTIKFLSNPVAKEINEVREFQKLIPQARFLFGNEIASYMEVIWQKSLVLTMYEAGMATFRLHGKIPSKTNTKYYNLAVDWYHSELEKVEDRFMPFFNFSTSIEPPFKSKRKFKLKKTWKDYIKNIKSSLISRL